MYDKNLRMITTEHELYSQFKYNNSLPLYVNYNNKFNLIENGFLLEFSGNIEIIELN
jgi:hypothetical protein